MQFLYARFGGDYHSGMTARSAHDANINHSLFAQGQVFERVEG